MKYINTISAKENEASLEERKGIPSKSQQKLSTAKGEAESFQKRKLCQACRFTMGCDIHRFVRTATWILNQDDIAAHVHTMLAFTYHP